MAGRKPGGQKSGGRKKGTANKTTEELKAFYVALISKNTEHIEDALEQLRLDDPQKFLMAIDKISNKVVANKKDITSDGESLAASINIHEDRTERKAD